MSAAEDIKQYFPQDKIRQDAESLLRYSVDTATPQVIVYPSEQSEVSDILNIASKHRAPVIIWGGGTSISRGNPPSAYEIAVDMSRLSKVVSHDVDNFSITVQAGTKLSELQNYVGTSNQFLPLNPSVGEEATLGGIVSTNSSGSLQLAFGGIRDLVLGLKVLLPEGDTVNFGGKTMKNVAGYDLGKLLIGAHGSLGVILEVTLRLFSLPERRESILLITRNWQEVFNLVGQILQWRPVALQIFSCDEAEGAKFFQKIGLDAGSCLVKVDLMGDGPAVEKQYAEISRLNCGRPLVKEDEEGEKYWREMNLQTMAATKDYILCSIGLPPGRIEEWINRAVGKYTCIVGCPGTGRIWVKVVAKSVEVATEKIEALRANAVKLGGWMIVENIRPEWKASVSVWGDIPPQLSILQAINESFDPIGIMSPGRLLGKR